MSVDALEAYKQVTDPWSGKVVASWGWLRESKVGPNKYWVFIEGKHEVFSREETAREYFYSHTYQLRHRINSCRARQERGIPRKSKAAVAGR